MDRNYIVELIKDNRLQEAIKAIEKASEGSHLHNQVIMLSSSYAEYAELNRSATEDFETLQMQRAKITNRLLSVLDEISPEDLEKVTPPPAVLKRPNYAPQPSEASSLDTIGGIDKKWVMIGGGALAFLLVLYLIVSKLTAVDEGFDSPETTVAAQNGNNAEHNNAATQGDGQEAITGRNVRFALFTMPNGEERQYREYDYGKWIEENIAHPDPAQTFKFEEIKRDDGSVYMRDESRGVGITIQLDLIKKQIKYSDDKGKSFVLYKIDSYH
jgi:hypothetical protein